MINRIQHLLGQRAEPAVTGEHFVVTGEFGHAFVSRAEAMRLRALTSRLLVPRWLEFRTLMGSTIRVRARQVNLIVESTIEQRAAMRQFWREREKEENTDRPPWEAD